MREWAHDPPQGLHVSSIPLIAKHAQAAQIEQHLLSTVGVASEDATTTDLMLAVAQVAREQLSQRWVETQVTERARKARRVVYLSMEFLMGRTLGNALAALQLTGGAAQGLALHAHTLEDVAEREPDAALGNGGLGRLAACFLDSMATLGLPSYGYGGGVSRPLAAGRHALGVSPRRYFLPGALWRLGGAHGRRHPLAPWR
jgi:glucan phosphorylase